MLYSALPLGEKGGSKLSHKLPENKPSKPQPLLDSPAKILLDMTSVKKNYGKRT